MARHGSLCLLTIRSGRCRADRYRACAFTLSMLMVGILGSTARAESHPIDATFRLQWPSDLDHHSWVRVEVLPSNQGQSAGTISEVRNRSRSPLSTGAFQSNEDQSVITFRPREAVTDGGFDFRVTAPANAQLQIQVVDRSKFEKSSDCFEPTPGNRVTIVPVTNLLGGDVYDSVTNNDGLSDPQWKIQRIQNDQVRIELDRSDALYEEDSPDKMRIRIRASSVAEFAGQSSQFSATIHRVADDEVIARETWATSLDRNGNTDEIIWQQDVPATPGVYEIRCELKPVGSRIWPRLRRSESSLFVAAQPLIVAPSPGRNHDTDARDWREIALIRPADGDRPALNLWLPSTASRLNPLAAPAVTPKRLEVGQHAGQPVAIIGPEEPFEVTLPTLVAGHPQKVTLRLPANPNLQLRVEVIHSDGNASPNFVFSPGTPESSLGPWNQQTFAYYPGDGETRIRITNLRESDSAMIESISVQAGPAEIQPHEMSGPNQLSTDQRLAIYSISNFDWVDALTHDIDSAGMETRYSASTVSLHRITIATKRLDGYLLSSGMNAVVLPVIADQRAWCRTSVMYPTRIDDDTDHAKMKLCLRLLESSPLKVLAGVEISATMAEVESTINDHADLALGAIRDSGDMAANPTRYNPLHSAVQSSILTLIGELDEQLQDAKNYAGVSILCADGSHLSPLSSSSGFDSATLERFASSALVSNESVPRSPALAKNWASQDEQRRFESWKTHQLCGLYRLISDGITGKTLLRFSSDVANREIYSALDDYRVDRTPRVAAVEATNSCLVVLNDLQRVPMGALPHRLRLEKLIPSLGYRQERDKSTGKINVGFCILDSDFGRANSVDAGSSHGFSQAALRARTTRDVAQILEKENPELLVFEGLQVSGTVNLELADLLTGWVTLPIDSVAELNPPDPMAATARLRFGRSDDHYFLMAINLAPWQSELVVQTSKAMSWRKAGTNKSKATTEFQETNSVNNDGLRMRLRLEPHQVVVLHADTPEMGIQVLDWYVHNLGGKDQIDKISSQVSKIVDRIGGLANPPEYRSLTNGSFEADSRVGLVGWLHAQHPPGAVHIDDKEAIDGKNSIVLSTEHSDGDRTWLVSETIQPPRSGRLAVSLACRAEMSNANDTHRLRVSIEGTRAGEPIRESSEIEIARNGQWRPRQFVLEVEGVNPSSVDSLRLTIDSLSKGRVWIDDIRLHDWFPVSRERSELQAEAYVAVQGLQRGNLTPAARLLQNEWAQHLLSINEPAPPDVIEVAKPEESSPGVAERLRSWLPGPLRF